MLGYLVFPDSFRTRECSDSAAGESETPNVREVIPLHWWEAFLQERSVLALLGRQGPTKYVDR
jgi:hypothetical protein